MKTLKWVAVLVGLTCLGGQFAPVHAQGIDTQYEPIRQLGRGGIFSLDWSPDGNMLAVAGYAGVWIYTPTLEDIAYLDTPTQVKTIVWSSDGSRLAAGAYAPEPALIIWDTFTWQIETELPLNNKENLVLAWSSDGHQIATGFANGTVQIWDVLSGQQALSLTHDAQVRAIHWSADQATLMVVAGFEQTSASFEIYEWDVDTGDIIRRRQPAPGTFDMLVEAPLRRKAITEEPLEIDLIANFLNVNPILFCGISVGMVVAMVAVVRLIGLQWKARRLIKALAILVTIIVTMGLIGYLSVTMLGLALSGGHLISFPEGDSTAQASISSDGAYLATGDLQGRIMIWDIALGKRVALATNEEYFGLGTIQDLAWQSSENQLAIVSNRILLWDKTTGFSDYLTTIDQFTSDLPNPDHVAWQPDSTTLAAIYSDWQTGWESEGRGSGIQRLAIWDYRTQRYAAISSAHQMKARVIAWSPDSNRIAGYLGNQLNIWDTASGEILSSLPLRDEISNLVWSPDGSALLLVGYRASIWIWDTRPGVPIRQLQAYQNTVFKAGADWSPDGTQVAATGPEGSVMIFNTVTGKLLRQMTGHSQTATAIAWNPGWQYVASAGDDFTVRLWDASSGLQVAVLEGHEGPVNDVDWSPDGTYLVSSGNDNRIIIWEVATKQKYLETRVEGRATGIEWSPDGSQIMVEGCQQITNQECRSGIRLLEASAGSELAFMPGKSFSMTQAAWSPVGSQFASAYEEGVILIWKSQPLGEHRHVHQIAHVLDEQTLGAGFGLEDDIGTP